MQEGDRDALDLQLSQFRRERAHGCFVQREANRAVRVDALGHGEAQAAGRQRLRLVDAEIVLVVAALGRDIEHVAEAIGGDQRGLGAAPLDDGVGRKRGAMNEDVDVADMGTRVSENETHPVEHRLLGPLRRRQHLAGFARLAHVQHDIRERAADIDGKPHFGSLKHSETLRADRPNIAKIAAISIPATAPMVKRVAPMR